MELEITVILINIFFLCSIVNSTNWAVLIAGSKDWDDYRHQADVMHVYRVLKNGSVPLENIITIVRDNLIDDPRNTHFGSIYNWPQGEDLNTDFVVDYSGTDVTPLTFMDVLLGKEDKVMRKGTGKVLKSGPDDHVFIYYSDHGLPGILLFPDEDYITYNELLETFERMHAKKLYGKMLVYIESCFAGSLVQDLNPEINILAVTASNATEVSFAKYCGQMKGLPCLGDKFTSAFLFYIKQYGGNNTIESQYVYARDRYIKRKNFSHVSQYGDLKMSSLMISDFFGNYSSLGKRSLDWPRKGNHEISYSDDEYKFISLRDKLNNSIPGSSEERNISNTIYELFTVMKLVNRKIEMISTALSSTQDELHEILNGRYQTRRQDAKCFDRAFGTLLECFISKPEKHFGSRQTLKLINMCRQPQLTTDEIVNAIKFTCAALKYETASLTSQEECWMENNLCDVLCFTNGKLKGHESHGKCNGKICECFEKKQNVSLFD